MDDDDAKALLRARVRAARAARPPAGRAAAAAALAARVLALPEVAAAAAAGAPVAAYASYGGEPGTGPLRAGLRAAGARVLLPVLAGAGLAWAEDAGGPVPAGPPGPSGRPGPPQPHGPLLGTGARGLRDLGVAVVLLPATAAGADGSRLGRGAGYYDRALAGLPRAPGGPLRVALVHDDEVVAAVPVDAHDEPVDAVVTPARTLRTG